MDTDPERIGSGIRLHFSVPDLKFWKKVGVGAGFGMHGMMYIECM